jgi:hypothetical protein
MDGHGVTVEEVERREKFWRVRDSAGTTYATRDAWVASLAHEYQKSRQRVRMLGGAGWYYRDLAGIERLDEGA